MLRERGKRKRYTTEEIREFLKRKGITLLSDYTLSQSPILVSFDACGHKRTTTWNQLRTGRGCADCARNARLTDEDYLEAARKHGGELLEKSRTGNMPSLWRCSLGHVFRRCLVSIRSLGTFCTECSASYAEMLCRTDVERLFGKPFRRVLNTLIFTTGGS